MTPVFSVRRRAEEFDALIDSSTGHDLSDARYAEFLEIVSALRDVPAAQARPEFVSSLREQLMLAARTELVPSEEGRLALPVRRRPRDRRIAAAVGGFAIVGATTSMAMAAQSALPGDALYPLKRAIENVEAGISVNEGQKGATLLANASGRLDEISALSRAGRLDDTTAIAETLNTFTDQAAAASDLLLSDYASTGDESSISELRDFTALSMETLAELESLVPADARDELLHAARVLTQIDAEAQQACPDCAGGITEIPKILAGSATYSSGGSTGASTVRDTGTKGGTRGGVKDDGSKTDDPQAPTEDSLTDTTVISAPGDETDGGDGGGGEEETNDPIGDLTEGLTGGETQPTSSPSGVPGLPAVDEVAEDLDAATEDVLNP